MTLTYKPSPSSSGKHWTQTQQSDVQVIHYNDMTYFNTVSKEYCSFWPIFAKCSLAYIICALQHLFFIYLFCFLAEKFLESVEGNQNYPLLLLTLLEKSQDNVIRVCAAVTFKNYIKRNWRIVSLTK